MRYVEFLDIDVPHAGALGTIEFDPWLAAVASLKTSDGQTMVTHWIDPSPAMSIVENGELFLRDAAHDGVMQTVAAQGVLEKTTALNGQPTFTASTPSALAQGTSPNVNPNEWSMIAVCRLSNPSPGDRYDLFGIGVGSLSGNLFPGLEIHLTATDANQIIVREGGTTTRRISGVSTDLFGSPVLVASTFSVDHGLSVFKNNMVDLTREPDDTRPLTMPTFSYLGNRSGANAAIGDFGMAFILRADLSRPEYRAHRDVLLGGLMGKYGIS